MRVKKTSDLTLHDVLSQLTLPQAEKCLGPEAAALIPKSGAVEINISALRKTLLNAELLPYQLDGIAFAAGAGRAVLADEMGLGKTIQGVGVAEFLAQH